MELRVGLCFQANIPLIFSVLQTVGRSVCTPGRWLGISLCAGRAGGAEGMPVGTVHSVPPIPGYAASPALGVPGWEMRSSGRLLIPLLLVWDVGGFAVNRERGPNAELLAPAPSCSSCSCLGGGGGLGKRTWKHPSVGLGNGPASTSGARNGLSITRHRTGMCPSRAQPRRDARRGTPLASLLEDER